MSSCCTLRSLRLQDCDQLIHVRISHAQLQRLEVDFCGSLISLCIHADKLEWFSYKGHKVNIEYECARLLHQLRAYFVKNECPLDFIGALPNLPKLKTLVLQFPTRLQVSYAVRHSGRFAGLTEIVLFLLTSWEESIFSPAYLLKAAPLVEKLWLHGCSKLQQPSELKNIRWPEDFVLGRLNTINIIGFSGESELMELLYFLLLRAPVLEKLQIETRALEPWFVRSQRHQSQDATRCWYAREMALTDLVPRVPSTVKFSII